MSANREIRNILREIVSKTVLITVEEELELVRKWHEEQDFSARNALITSHLKLIAGWATRFSNSGAEYEDLFNEGVLALSSAVDKFDASKQNRLSSYAVWWILSNYQDALARDIYTVKLGKSRKEKKALRLVITARQQLGANLDPKTIDLISELSGVPTKDVQRLDGVVASRSISMNATVGSDNEDGAEVGDSHECQSAKEKNAENLILSTDQRRILLDVFTDLTDPRAPKILQERWLSDSLNGQEKKLEEIGKDLGISAERVRQIERDAIKEMHKLLKARGYAAEDLLTGV